MRTGVVEIIKAAAMSAGLPESSVMHTPDEDGTSLPARRIEISYLPEAYRHTGRTVGKFPTPGAEDVSRTLRREVYAVRLGVLAAIRADDDAWLTDFSADFAAALPKIATDAGGKTIGVTLERAEYGGFTGPLDASPSEPSKTFHITFTGRITRDIVVPLIREVSITPTYTETGNGQE